MSILSTNQRLIKVGQDYSAGENIGINDNTISSRNWTPDITYASESAYSRSTAYTNDWIEGQYSSDLTATNERITNLSGDIDYISGVAITAHQSLDGYLTKASGDEYYQPKGSYATLTQLENTSGEIVNLIPTDFVTNETLEQTSGNIVNLIPDTSEFITNASAEATYQPIGNYLSSNALEGYATQDWVSEQGYLTSVSIPESATWQDVSTTVQTNSAQWAEGGGGDEEVNEFVYNNSATINEVNTSYQTNSGTFLTSHQAISAEEWNSNYETVNTNSGAWGGSALPISAGPGIKVNLVDNTLVFSNDETVLWSGGNLAMGSTATLSETVKNFELFGVYGHETNRGRGVYQEFNPNIVVNSNTQNLCLFLPDFASDNTWFGWYAENLYFTDTAATALVNVSGRQTWRWYANNTWEDGGTDRYIQVDKIVGINRKQ